MDVTSSPDTCTRDDTVLRLTAQFGMRMRRSVGALNIKSTNFISAGTKSIYMHMNLRPIQMAYRSLRSCHFDLCVSHIRV